LKIKFISILVIVLISFGSFAKNEIKSIAWTKTSLYNLSESRVADFYHHPINIEKANPDVIARCIDDSEYKLKLEKIVKDSSGLFYYIFYVPYHDDLSISYIYNPKLDEILNVIFIPLA